MFTSVRASTVVARMLLRDTATKVVVGIMFTTEILNIVVLVKHVTKQLKRTPVVLVKVIIEKRISAVKINSMSKKRTRNAVHLTHTTLTKRSVVKELFMKIKENVVAAMYTIFKLRVAVEII